ncbi:MAG: (d)CMP kinase [bacterium]
MKKLVVTIDGPAASGKSTTARTVARRLGYNYLDTGAMYRAMGFKAIKAGVDVADEAGMAELARNTSIDVETLASGTRIILDGVDVTDDLRSPEVSAAASAVAALGPVRERMVEIQREIGAGGGIVAEGRDIGSVVFPEAEVKIYLDADLRTRAVRRKKELNGKGTRVELARVERDIRSRDKTDTNRQHSPLVIPEGAAVVNTTYLTIEEQIEEVLREVRARM